MEKSALKTSYMDHTINEGAKTPCLQQSWKPLIHLKNKYSFGDTFFPALQLLQCHLHPNLLYNLPLLPLINFPACYLTSLGTVQCHYSHWLGTPYAYHSLPVYNILFYLCASMFLYNPEDKGSKLLWNVSNYIQNYMTPYPKRPESLFFNFI
jgi:hypothetical protein